MIQLRPYQLNAVEAICQAIRDGHRRILVCSVTGSGKTAAAASMLEGAYKKGNPAAFVAARKEIIDQTVKTLAQFGVADVSVIRATDKREDRAKLLQVCSVQTLARRPLMDPPPKLIFIDEAHHAPADSYTQYIFKSYPSAIIVGITATPSRSDGRILGGDLFTKLIIATTYAEMFDGGYLSEPMTYGTPLLPDLSKVRTVAGDYNQEDLEKAVNKGHLIGNVIEQWLKLAENRRTVVFAVSVAHSRSLAQAFVDAGVKAEHLDGETDMETREAILARLESGETTVVTQVGVLSEGWDQPSCKCCVITRPTKSIVNWKQWGGRVLRPWGGIVPLILDHAGCCDRFGGPVHVDVEWSLTEKAKRSSLVPPMRACPVCFAMILSALPRCPHCGAEMPAPKAAPTKERKTIPLDLALREVPKLDLVESEYIQYNVAQARRLGWHWAAVGKRYEEHFSKPLPLELKAIISAQYKSDDIWKANRKKRADAKKDPQTVLRPSP